ncbi:hypothetical protein [Sulfurimonas marina]|uniref:Uncharacterized protein n=1 Tax=Sulfurimonas marina TaxID=2590551 RepID=A0A7M1AW88_9BACT|nr:hypothetical protein [Sulfurimonas marina]QOP41719.1 hypothetical protein FJR03_08205 [Sulfurimonas marina]
MNQVNPLHIGALLLTVLLFLFFKLSTFKEELLEAKLQYQESKKVAVKLNALEDVYGDQKKIKSSIERILRQPSLKSANIIKKVTKDSIKISAKTMNADALNSLMGKVLNGSYNISLLEIKKLGDDTVSLEMEIKW